MKKTLLTLIFVVAAITITQAQVWIGGSVNAQLNKDFKSFTIAPDVGYCFANSPFSIACAVEYGGTFQKGEAYTHSLIVSPYCRYNICDISERFSLFSDLVFDCDVLEFNFFDIMLCPGISFDLTEHWSAEFSVGLLGYEWERVSSDIIEHRFVLDFATVAPSFGIYYSF